MGKAALYWLRVSPRKYFHHQLAPGGVTLCLIPYVKRQAHGTGMHTSQGHCNVTAEALGSKSDFRFFPNRTGGRVGWYGHSGKQPEYSL